MHKKIINNNLWINGIYYYKDAKYTILHREDGPAIIYANGDKEWYFNGECHREDGPAVIWTKGNKFYYLNNQNLSKEEYIEHIKSKPICLAKKSRILKRCT